MLTFSLLPDRFPVFPFPEGYVHRGITCNHCNSSPIRGTRYKCANCVDFDLCEGCEALQPHKRTHVFLKIRVPVPPLANPRSALVPILYPGGEFIIIIIFFFIFEMKQKKSGRYSSGFISLFLFSFSHL
jgi:hypothetical protein